jgi:hypothetical protein
VPELQHLTGKCQAGCDLDLAGTNHCSSRKLGHVTIVMTCERWTSQAPVTWMTSALESDFGRGKQSQDCFVKNNTECEQSACNLVQHTASSV